MKILVVEDDFISRKVIASILSEFGTVDIAVNGLEAQEAVQLALKEESPYNLICLDIMMPEMDGHEVLQKIRADEAATGEYLNNGVKIIMTTVLKDMKNVMKAYNNLCNGYLTKPIDRGELMAVLVELELVD